MGKILVTGAAGFIGSAVSRRLVADGHQVIGIDIRKSGELAVLQERRLEWIRTAGKFLGINGDIRDGEGIRAVFAKAKPDVVIHLAAEVGVRRSFEFPKEYGDVNVLGFLNVIEGARIAKVPHFIYASSSSVYGGSANLPWTESRATDEPLSLYAATKKSNELIANTYTGLHGVATTGLRFFSAYGPWGRPDMAYYDFAKKIMAGQTIPLFHQGNHARDFTYIDDIVEVVARLIRSKISRPSRIFNVGKGTPISLTDLVKHLEAGLGRKARVKLMDRQPGDALITQADVQALRWDLGYSPQTKFEDGIAKFLTWFKEYHAKDFLEKPAPVLLSKKKTKKAAKKPAPKRH